MPLEIRIPEVNAARDSTVLLRWLKRKGDRVREGEPVAEVESDKGVIEVDAGTSGVLGDLLVREGEEVAAGEVAAVILDESG